MRIFANIQTNEDGDQVVFTDYGKECIIKKDGDSYSIKVEVTYHPQYQDENGKTVNNGDDGISYPFYAEGLTKGEIVTIIPTIFGEIKELNI